MTFTTIKNIYIYVKSPETCRYAGPDAVEPLNHPQGHLHSDSVLGEKSNPLFVENTIISALNYLVIFVKETTGHKCKGLFLDSQLHSTDPCVLMPLAHFIIYCSFVSALK